MHRGFMGGNMGGFFESIFRHMDERKKAERKMQAGVTLMDGYEGIERVGIPHKYDDILIAENHFSCHTFDTMTIYDKNGKFFFECHGAEYLGDEMFLVGVRGENKDSHSFGYALYHNEKKLTDYIFRPTSHTSKKFNEFGLCEVRLFDGGHDAIIDNTGQVLIQGSSYSDYLRLKGVVCSFKEQYINLLTGNVICTKKYSSNKELSTKELLFVEVDDNCVYQINKNTGDVLVHGEIPKKEEPKKEQPIEPKKIEPKIKIPQRNDPCYCNSGKKYKHCCMSKTEEFLNR